MMKFTSLFLLIVALFVSVQGEQHLRARATNADPTADIDGAMMNRIKQRYLQMADTQDEVEKDEASRNLEMSMSMSMPMVRID